MRYSEINEAPAYHGSNNEFDTFSFDHIGAGMGYQTFGWGIYLTADKRNARNYVKKRKGYVYETDIPDPSLMLDWEARFTEQSPHVQQCLMDMDYPAMRQKAIDDELMSAGGDYASDTGEDIHGTVASILMTPSIGGDPDFLAKHQEDKKQTSLFFLKHGIVGTKFLDVESRPHKIWNYVLFDTKLIKIIHRAHM